MENNNINETNNNALGLTPEEIQAFKEEQAAKKVTRMRKETLENWLNDPMLGETRKELYNNGLKEMLDSDPAIIDSEGTLSASMRLAQQQYQAKKKLKEQESQKQETVNTSAPLTQKPIVTDNVDSGEDGKVLQNLSYKEKVAAGISRTTAIFSTVFPPKHEMKIK